MTLSEETEDLVGRVRDIASRPPAPEVGHLSPTQILGLDLSLTATGVAVDGEVETISFPRLKGMPRLAAIRDEVMAIARGRSRLALIEGYAYNAHQSGERLGELGGVIRLALWEAGVGYVEVAPSTLKLFATGKGNAPKDQVLTAAVRAGFTGDDNNAADAFWLHALGVYKYVAGVEGIACRDKAVKALPDSVPWAS